MSTAQLMQMNRWRFLWRHWQSDHWKFSSDSDWHTHDTTLFGSCAVTLLILLLLPFVLHLKLFCACPATNLHVDQELLPLQAWQTPKFDIGSWLCEQH